MKAGSESPVVTTADEKRRLPGTRAYSWKHVLLLQGRSQTVARQQLPSRRLSATLIVANRNPLSLGINGCPPRTYRAALLAPDVHRDSFEAIESDFTIVDIDIASAAYERLAPSLVTGTVAELSDTEVLRLQGLLALQFLAAMSCGEVQALFDGIVTIVTESRPPGGIRRDPRILKVIELIERLPFNELSLRVLAQETFLSESRLRHLFRQHMGCTLSRYARWANVRKVLDLWRPGMPFSVAITQAGFHDQAHFGHAARQFFSLTPSAMAAGAGMQLTRCDCAESHHRERLAERAE
jgi:AraC-like DNA-binding protein